MATYKQPLNTPTEWNITIAEYNKTDSIWGRTAGDFKINRKTARILGFERAGDMSDADIESFFNQLAYKIVKGLANRVKILKIIPLNMLPQKMQTAMQHATYLTIQHTILNMNENPMEKTLGNSNNIFSPSSDISGWIMSSDFIGTEANNVISESMILNLSWDPKCKVVRYLNLEFKFPILDKDGNTLWNLKEINVVTTADDKNNGKFDIVSLNYLNDLINSGMLGGFDQNTPFAVNGKTQNTIQWIQELLTNSGNSKIEYFDDWTAYENDVATRPIPSDYVLSFIASADTIPTSVLKVPVLTGHGCVVGLARSSTSGSEQSDVIWTQEISMLQHKRIEDAVSFLGELLSEQIGITQAPIGINQDGNNQRTKTVFNLPSNLEQNAKYYVEIYNNTDNSLMNFLNESDETPAFFTNTNGSNVNWKLGAGSLTMRFRATVVGNTLELALQGSQLWPSFNFNLKSVAKDIANPKTLNERIIDLESKKSGTGVSIYPNYSALQTAYNNAKVGDTILARLEDPTGIPSLYSLPTTNLNPTDRFLFVVKKTQQAQGSDAEKLAQDSVFIPGFNGLESILSDKGYAYQTDVTQAFQMITDLQQTQGQPAKWFADGNAFRNYVQTLSINTRASAIVENPGIGGLKPIQKPGGTITWSDSQVAYIFGWSQGTNSDGTPKEPLWVIIPLIDLTSGQGPGAGTTLDGDGIITKIGQATIQKIMSLRHLMGLGYHDFTIQAGQSVDSTDLVASALGSGKVKFTTNTATGPAPVTTQQLFKYAAWPNKNDPNLGQALSSAYWSINPDGTQEAIVSTSGSLLIQQTAPRGADSVTAQLRKDIVYNGVTYRAGTNVKVIKTNPQISIDHRALQIQFNPATPSGTTKHYSLKFTTNGWKFVNDANPTDVIEIPAKVPTGGVINVTFPQVPKPQNLSAGNGLTITGDTIALSSATQTALVDNAKHNTVVAGSNVSISTAANTNGGVQYTINASGGSGGTGADPQTATNTQGIAANSQAIQGLIGGTNLMTQQINLNDASIKKNTKGVADNTKLLTTHSSAINTIYANQIAYKKLIDANTAKLGGGGTGTINTDSIAAALSNSDGIQLLYLQSKLGIHQPGQHVFTSGAPHQTLLQGLYESGAQVKLTVHSQQHTSRTITTQELFGASGVHYKGPGNSKMATPFGDPITSLSAFVENGYATVSYYANGRTNFLVNRAFVPSTVNLGQGIIYDNVRINRGARVLVKEGYPHSGTASGVILQFLDPIQTTTQATDVYYLTKVGNGFQWKNQGSAQPDFDATNWNALDSNHSLTITTH